MFTIYDGRKQFYQWDIDRKLIVDDDSIKEVHFCNKTDECSLVCETYKDNNTILVNVPNILLTTDWRVNVYAFDGKATKHCATFNVVGRTKPADYIYTETEIKNYEDLAARIEELEKNGEIPKTIHFRYGSDYDYPRDDPWEWLNKYPSDSDVYTSEPLLVYLTPTQWNCFVAVHTWVEPDPDDESTWFESANWETLEIMKSTDFPKDKSELGVIIRDTDNYLAINPAKEYEIKKATDTYKPIVSSTLGYGVGTHGIARLATMPAAESKHLDWIVLYTGATNDTYKNNTMYICVNDGGYKWVEYTLAQIGDIETALDSIIAIQNSLIGGDAE